jgi:hypothetical protein
VKSACTTSATGRLLHRPFDQAYIERVRGYHETPSCRRAIRKRKVWVEPLFGEAKTLRGLRRFRLRGLEKVNTEGLMIAAGQNLKRLLRHQWRPDADLERALSAIALYLKAAAARALRDFTPGRSTLALSVVTKRLFNSLPHSRNPRSRRLKLRLQIPGSK